MYVLKRDGRKEPVRFDKITARINKLSYGLNTQFCDPVSWKRAARVKAALVVYAACSVQYNGLRCRCLCHRRSQQASIGA